MAAINQFLNKQALVSRLLAAKESTGKTFTQISREVGLTNVYTAQLFYNQAQLKPDRVEKLKKAVPELKEEDINIMKRVPFRSYNESIAQEPLVYRLKEVEVIFSPQQSCHEPKLALDPSDVQAVLHNGESIHAICAEEFGDGIMSAIDIFTSVQNVEGATGEKRVCIQLNGKFLPHIEQDSEKNTAPTK